MLGSRRDVPARLAVALGAALLWAGCDLPFGGGRNGARPGSGPASSEATETSPFAQRLAQSSTLSAALLRHHVAFLASDELEGRGAASQGIRKAADFLERELRRMHLQPLFDQSYRQALPIAVGARLGEDNRIVQAGPAKFRVGKDFVPYTFSTSGEVEGPLVFAGYGVRAPEHHYDDYAEVEVEGRVVVVLAGEPSEDDPHSPFDGRQATRHSSVRAKVVAAREAGALAVLVINDKLGLPGPRTEAESDAGILAVQIASKTAQKLLGFDPLEAKARIDKHTKPESRAAKRPAVRIVTSITRDESTVENIGALLVPPSGPDVMTSTETVLLGAHYDHLGWGGSASLADNARPTVHNGADDNASGVAVALEVMRALAQRPEGLRRRVAVVLFAGEEAGLLGSGYFVKHSPIERSALSTMLNLDMVGQLRDQRVLVHGSESAHEFKAFAEHWIRAHGLEPVLNGESYGPSDHSSFAAEGVAVLELTTGPEPRYHRPEDRPEVLNYVGMAELGATVADMVRVLATVKERPRAP
jgi:hypothetical protein